MTGFEHNEKDSVSRQRAAERLIDIAYALTAGCPLELSLGGRRIVIPVGDQVLFARESKSEGTQFELALELSWSMPGSPRPVAGRPKPVA